MGGRREAVVRMRWGTWEELVLGGAVLKHGTEAWETVASEVRARSYALTLPFTPKECEAKYEDLQERYCGCTCTTWFEKLRKQRVAELKMELKRSEESIGSLQSKLESLISEREGKNNTDCDVDHTPTQNVEVKCPGKQISKDRLSAGSFTEDTMRDCSVPIAQVPEKRQMEENEKKVEAPHLDREKAAPHNMEVGRLSVKKRRGKRKRKDCEDQKEGSESDVLSSANADKEKEASSEGCNEAVTNSQQRSGSCDGKEVLDLAAIMTSFVTCKDLSIFRGRLESQKRARYKKLIRRHVDFSTIESGIDDGTISTTRELYRDLLLLSNNALLFYPKNSSEYKAALKIRDAATRQFHHASPKDPSHDSAASITSANRDSSCSSSAAREPDSLNKEVLDVAKAMQNPVMKPRNMRPCNNEDSGKAVPKAARSSRMPSTGNRNNGKLSSGGGSMVKLAMLAAESIAAAAAAAMKGIGPPAKRGREAARKTPAVPVKGRMKACRR